ncbi:hypothetical protein TIFTF001_013114 [Ficus carica]|uniref:Uncharacterized protein n=1 Tax=Ficus carica TaxID=3494 RepID=A0AA87ZX49_FICCA|nr:hypothetical protein TIFTF001_013114 [Ficus carica]
MEKIQPPNETWPDQRSRVATANGVPSRVTRYWPKQHFSDHNQVPFGMVGPCCSCHAVPYRLTTILWRLGGAQ